MRPSSLHRSVLIVAALCNPFTTYAFLDSAGLARIGIKLEESWYQIQSPQPLAQLKRNRSYKSLFGRASGPELDDEEDLAYPLGDCARSCNGGTPERETAGASVKRSKTLFEGSCSSGSSTCSKVNGNATSSTSSLRRRALPAFGGPDDLRRKNTAELANWMMARMPDPNVHGYPPDVEMLWEDVQEQYVEIRPPGKKTGAIGWGIPTSFFAQPGTERFAWGTIGLIGCSMFTIVKEPTQQDPSSGVYMAHIWEIPGFSNHKNAKGQIDTYAQPNTWIKWFIKEGFPPQPNNFKRRITAGERDWETAFQEGLNNHGAHLGNGFAIAMHPNKYDPQDNNGVQTYVRGEGPQFPKGLSLMKDTVNEVMRDDHQSSVNWNEDYLYLPAREDDRHTRAWNTPSGRSLFEYDPNFQLADGSRVRMGMLLLEDGGPQGPRRADGTYEPGPGGPFFFRF